MEKKRKNADSSQANSNNSASHSTAKTANEQPNKPCSKPDVTPMEVDNTGETVKAVKCNSGSSDILSPVDELLDYEDFEGEGESDDQVSSYDIEADLSDLSDLAEECAADYAPIGLPKKSTDSSFEPNSKNKKIEQLLAKGFSFFSSPLDKKCYWSPVIHEKLFTLMRDRVLLPRADMQMRNAIVPGLKDRKFSFFRALLKRRATKKAS